MEQHDKVHIVNAALIELGLEPSYSTDATGDIGKHVTYQWDRCVARCLGLHDWTFCRVTVRLAARAQTPLNGYAYSYDLPGDRLGAPLKLLSDPQSRTPLRVFTIEGDTLYANEAAVWLRYRAKRDPQTWPDQFADAFTIALAAMLAKPMLQDSDLALELKMEAFGGANEGGTGGLFGRLIAQDRAGEPMPDQLYADDPLTSAHGGGSWDGR